MVVNLETLLGLNDHPADLQGHGPVTAHLARELAFNAGSTWRRMVIDDLHGYVLDFGRTKYKAPRPLAEHVQARDFTCRTPGCPRPAVLCDADHLVSWPAGVTSQQNLCSECRHDHRLKHEGRRGHHLSSDPEHPPGTVLITTATGHVYMSVPHDYRPLRPSILPNLRPHDPARSPAPHAGEQAARRPGGPGDKTGEAAGVTTGGQAGAGQARGGQAGAGQARGGQDGDQGTGGMRFAAKDWLCLNPLPDDGSGPPQTNEPDPGPLPF